MTDNNNNSNSLDLDMDLDENTIIQNIANDYEVTLPLKKKRGRKSKKEIEMLNKMKEENMMNDEIIYGESKPVAKYKKRGRKPKGGKIIQNVLSDKNEPIVKTNVILHLKCFLSDIKINTEETLLAESPYEGVSMDKSNNLTYNIIKTNSNSNTNTLNNNTNV